MRQVLAAAMLLGATGALAQETAPQPPAEASAADQPAASDPVAGEEDDDEGGRIVKGQPARVEEARWQAEIYAIGEGVYTADEINEDFRRAFANRNASQFLFDKKPWEYNHRCGGSLIAASWIVTAAHCAVLPCKKQPCLPESEFLKRRGVRMGTLDISGGGLTYRIERVVIHRGYDKPNNIHDIALMRIVPTSPPGKADFTPKTIRLLGSKPGDLGVSDNPLVTVTGWGLTGARERNSSMTFQRDGSLNRKSAALRIAGLTIKKPSACRPKFAAAMDSGFVLCVGSDDGRDSCQGDSGGPLTRAEGAERVLVGIVSGGEGCGIKGVPGLYVDAGKYDRWIAEAMRNSRPGRITRQAYPR